MKKVEINKSSIFFQDSGAFSAITYNDTIDLKEYIEHIKKNKKYIRVYCNLDVIGNIEETWENQRIMEKEGLRPLPVFHAKTDDFKYLDKCLEYDYFALGGMAHSPTFPLRISLLDKCWERIVDDKGFPKSKVHGFGMADIRLINRYPWFCMTEEDHEVLTKKGWKYRKDLKIGEDILSFDKGVSKWEKIENIPTFKVKNEEITVLENKNFKFKGTSNHNWVTCRINNKGKNWTFKKTKELNSDDCIPGIKKDKFLKGNINSASIDYIYKNSLKEKKEKYTGTLWCLQIPSKAFFVRCNNTVYVTGNSIDSSSWVTYGRFGIVIFPKTKNKIPVYNKPPVKLFVSKRTIKIKDCRSTHIDRLSIEERRVFNDYLKKRNIPIGKSEVKEVKKEYKLKKNEIFINKDNTKVEIIIEPGIINNSFYRDFINYCYYQEMVMSQPKYPWSWKAKRKTRRLF